MPVYRQPISDGQRHLHLTHLYFTKKKASCHAHPYVLTAFDSLLDNNTQRTVHCRSINSYDFRRFPTTTHPAAALSLYPPAFTIFPKNTHLKLLLLFFLSTGYYYFQLRTLDNTDAVTRILPDCSSIGAQPLTLTTPTIRLSRSHSLTGAGVRSSSAKRNGNANGIRNDENTLTLAKVVAEAEAAVD